MTSGQLDLSTNGDRQQYITDKTTKTCHLPITIKTKTSKIWRSENSYTPQCSKRFQWNYLCYWR